MGDDSGSKGSPAVKIAIISTVGVVVAALIGVLPSMIGDGDEDSGGPAPSREEPAGPWTSIFELQGQIGTIIDKVGQLSLGQEATESLDAEQSRRLEQLSARLHTELTKLQDAELAMSPKEKVRLVAAEAAVAHNRALIYYRQGRLADANLSLDRAITLYGTHPKEFGEQLARARNNRGVIAYRRGDSTKAAADMTAAKESYAVLAKETGRAHLKAALQEVEQGLELIKSDFPTGIVVEENAIGAITLTQFTREDFPRIAEVLLTQGSTVVQGSEGLGPLFVGPGTYDVHCNLTYGLRLMLLRGLRLEKRQRVTVNSDEAVGAISLDDPALPTLKFTKIVAQVGSTIHSQTTAFGSPMLVTAGVPYDVFVAIEGHPRRRVASGITPLPGKVTPVDLRKETAVLTVPDPTIEGLDLEWVYVFLAGKSTYIDRRSRFGEPMLVEAGNYDVKLGTTDGQLVLLASVAAPPGGEIVVNGEQRDREGDN